MSVNCFPIESKQIMKNISSKHLFAIDVNDTGGVP
jgi:hypothetical protein